MAGILLTSFEPFGGLAINSSHEVARAVVESPPPGIDLDWLSLPVVAAICADVALARLRQGGHRGVLALGQSAGASAVRVEGRANNLDDFPIPDNAGVRRNKVEVVAGGPLSLPAWLPVERVVERIQAARVPAELSSSAGAYVCNHYYYRMLHGLESDLAWMLFLHLPLLPSQVTKGQKIPTMALDAMASAVRAALTVLA